MKRKDVIGYGLVLGLFLALVGLNIFSIDRSHKEYNYMESKVSGFYHIDYEGILNTVQNRMIDSKMPYVMVWDILESNTPDDRTYVLEKAAYVIGSIEIQDLSIGEISSGGYENADAVFKAYINELLNIIMANGEVSATDIMDNDVMTAIFKNTVVRVMQRNR